MPDPEWLRGKLDIIEAKMDRLLVDHATQFARGEEHERRIAKAEDRQEITDRRIGALEQSRAWLLGAAAAIAAAISGAMKWIGGQGGS